MATELRLAESRQQSCALRGETGPPSPPQQFRCPLDGSDSAPSCCPSVRQGRSIGLRKAVQPMAGRAGSTAHGAKYGEASCSQRWAGGGSLPRRSTDATTSKQAHTEAGKVRNESFCTYRGRSPAALQAASKGGEQAASQLTGRRAPRETSEIAAPGEGQGQRSAPEEPAGHRALAHKCTAAR